MIGYINYIELFECKLVKKFYAQKFLCDKMNRDLNSNNSYISPIHVKDFFKRYRNYVLIKKIIYILLLTIVLTYSEYQKNIIAFTNFSYKIIYCKNSIHLTFLRSTKKLEYTIDNIVLCSKVM